jgi:hypothetical protein
MKHSILNILLPLVIAATFTTVASAQDLAADIRDKQAIADLYISAEETSTPLATTEIDKRVLKSFERNYGKVQGVRWFQTGKGYGVSFKNNGIRTIVFYTSNAAVDSYINYYSESKMPAYVRTLVKTNFPDFSITSVAEVHKGEVVAHIVTIQDSTTVKTMKVIGDEWEVTETLEKI